MQQNPLYDLLARLVADGEITEEQAAALLLALADGTFDELIPLPPFLRTYTTPGEDDRSVDLLIAALGGGLVAWLASRSARRTDGADLLMDQFAGEAERLARSFSSGNLTVAQFQQRLGQVTRELLLSESYLGAQSYGRMIGAVDQIMLTQSAYIQRFADQLALRRLNAATGGALNLPQFSASYLEQRIIQYSGPARSLFFRALEQFGAGEESDAGWVVRYVAVDDGGTCSPCRAAVGVYLPGAGPYPGEICAGGGNCRCRRVPEYDPEMYRQLGGVF